MVGSERALRAHYRNTEGGYPSHIYVARAGGMLGLSSGPLARLLAAQVFIARQGRISGQALSVDELVYDFQNAAESTFYVANDGRDLRLNGALGYARASLDVPAGFVRVDEIAVRDVNRAFSRQAHAAIVGALLGPILEDTLDNPRQHEDLARLDLLVTSQDPSDVGLDTMRRLHMQRVEGGFKSEALEAYRRIGSLGVAPAVLD